MMSSSSATNAHTQDNDQAGEAVTLEQMVSERPGAAPQDSFLKTATA